MGQGGGDGGETDRRGRRMTKWQKRALAAAGRGFKAIKTDSETDKQKGGGKGKQKEQKEAGINRMRGDLLKCSLRCDLSRDAQGEAQETVPSDRVATPLTDE